MPATCLPPRVPAVRSATKEARDLLPGQVPHADAAFTVGRAALAVHALTRDPSLLLAATEDRLHQDYRAAAMPDSAALIRRLRAEGFAAFVSGAGPTVLVLTVGPDWARKAADYAPEGWDVTVLTIASRGTVADSPPDDADTP